MDRKRPRSGNRPAEAAPAPAAAAGYLRPKGDRAQAVADPTIKDDDSDDSDDRRKGKPRRASKFPHLKHGDIVYKPGAYRGSQTYFVIKKGSSTWLVRDVDWSGYAQVLSNVTYQLEDPIDFYSSVAEKPAFIHLQRPHHDAVIRRIVGEARFKKLPKGGGVVWDTINEDIAEGMDEEGGGEE